MQVSAFLDNLVAFYNRKHDAFVERLKEQMNEKKVRIFADAEIPVAEEPNIVSVFPYFERFLKQEIFLLSRNELEQMVTGGQAQAVAQDQPLATVPTSQITVLTQQVNYLSGELKNWRNRFYKLEQTKMEQFYTYLRMGNVYVPDYVERMLKRGLNTSDGQRGQPRMGRDVGVQVGKHNRRTNQQAIETEHGAAHSNDSNMARVKSEPSSVSVGIDSIADESSESNTVVGDAEQQNGQQCRQDIYSNEQAQVSHQDAQNADFPASYFSKLLGQYEPPVSLRSFQDVADLILALQQENRNLQNQLAAQKDAFANFKSGDQHKNTAGQQVKLQRENHVAEGQIKTLTKEPAVLKDRAKSKSNVLTTSIGEEKQNTSQQTSQLFAQDRVAEVFEDEEEFHTFNGVAAQFNICYGNGVRSTGADTGQQFENAAFIQGEGNKQVQRSSYATQTELVQTSHCAVEVTPQYESCAIQCEEYKIELKNMSIQTQCEDKPKQQQKSGLLMSKGQIDQVFCLPKDQETMTTSSVFNMFQRQTQTLFCVDERAVQAVVSTNSKATMTDEDEEARYQKQLKQLQASVLRKKEQMQQIIDSNNIADVQTNQESKQPIKKRREKVLAQQNGELTLADAEKKRKNAVQEVNYQMEIKTSPERAKAQKSINQQTKTQHELDLSILPTKQFQQQETLAPSVQQQSQPKEAFFRQRRARVTDEFVSVLPTVVDVRAGVQIDQSMCNSEQAEMECIGKRQTAKLRAAVQDNNACALEIHGESKNIGTIDDALRLQHQQVLYRIAQKDQTAVTSKQIRSATLSQSESASSYNARNQQNEESQTDEDSQQDFKRDLEALLLLRTSPIPALKLNNQGITRRVSSKTRLKRHSVKVLRQKQAQIAKQTPAQAVSEQIALNDCPEFAEILRRYDYIPIKIELDATQLPGGLHYRCQDLELETGEMDLTGKIVFDLDK